MGCRRLIRKLQAAAVLALAAASLGAAQHDAAQPDMISQPPARAVISAESVTFDALVCAVATLERTPAVTISQYDAELIAKTLYGECRSCSKLQQAAVAWCILNRADHYGMSVEDVVTSPGQFAGYSAKYPVLPELLELAEDVLRRHAMEQLGAVEVGRVLPEEYLWFSGDGRENYFRNAYSTSERWDWSLPNPYTE